MEVAAGAVSSSGAQLRMAGGEGRRGRGEESNGAVGVMRVVGGVEVDIYLLGHKRACRKIRRA